MSKFRLDDVLQRDNFRLDETLLKNLWTQKNLSADNQYEINFTMYDTLLFIIAVCLNFYFEVKFFKHFSLVLIIGSDKENQNKNCTIWHIFYCPVEN